MRRGGGGVTPAVQGCLGRGRTARGVIRALLEAGADPRTLTDDGESPLHAAARGAASLDARGHHPAGGSWPGRERPRRGSGRHRSTKRAYTTTSRPSGNSWNSAPTPTRATAPAGSPIRCASGDDGGCSPTLVGFSHPVAGRERAGGASRAGSRWDARHEEGATPAGTDGLQQRMLCGFRERPSRVRGRRCGCECAGRRGAGPPSIARGMRWSRTS